MNRITEHFKTSSRGYDKNQVNEYISMLTTEFENLQNQYTALQQQSEQNQNDPTNNMELISKVLLKAELTSKRIIEDANNEAARIVGDAHVEMEKLQLSKAAIYNEISNLVSELYRLIPQQPKQYAAPPIPQPYTNGILEDMLK